MIKLFGLLSKLYFDMRKLKTWKIIIFSCKANRTHRDHAAVSGILRVAGYTGKVRARLIPHLGRMHFRPSSGPTPSLRRQKAGIWLPKQILCSFLWRILSAYEKCALTENSKILNARIHVRRILVF